MNYGEEIKKLEKEKLELEKRIKQLEEERSKSNFTKLDTAKYGWGIYIKKNFNRFNEKKTAWVMIAEYLQKEKAIEHIGELIEDLTSLKTKLEEGEE